MFSSCLLLIALHVCLNKLHPIAVDYLESATHHQTVVPHFCEQRSQEGRRDRSRAVIPSSLQHAHTISIRDGLSSASEGLVIILSSVINRVGARARAYLLSGH